MLSPTWIRIDPRGCRNVRLPLHQNFPDLLYFLVNNLSCTRRWHLNFKKTVWFLAKVMPPKVSTNVVIQVLTTVTKYWLSTIFGSYVRPCTKKIGVLLKNEDVQTRLILWTRQAVHPWNTYGFTMKHNDHSLGTHFKTWHCCGVVCLLKIQNSKFNSSTHH